MSLQTARLTIQPFTRELMLLALEHPRLVGAKLGLVVPAGWPNQDEHEALPFLANGLLHRPEQAQWGMQLLSDRVGRAIVGTAGFKGPPTTAGMVELGYGIAPEYQGRGYATEAVEGLVAWGFAQPGVCRIFADCLPTNLASRRVLEKAGFRQLPPSAEYLNWELRRPPAPTATT